MAVTVDSLGYKVLFECKLTSDPVKCTFKSDIWFSYPDFLQLVVGAKILGQWIRWVPGNLTVKYLFQKYYETIGPGRIIFGSDSSWFPRGFAKRYLEDQVRDCLDLNMPDEHIQQIFAGNAARLLKIELP